MNYKLLGSSIATVLIATSGAAIANTTEVTETQSAEIRDISSLNQSAPQNREGSPDEVVAAPATNSSETNIPSRAITSIYPHLKDETPAATLYVHRLPLITFLETTKEESAESNKSLGEDIGVVTPAQIREGLVSSVVESEEDPLWRATLAAEKIDRLSVKDAAKITATWNAERKTYVVHVDETELFTVDDTAILLNSTNNWERDTLQIVNKLRRLTGGAPSLAIADIETRPRSIAYAAPTRNYSVQSEQRGMASWYGGYFHGRRSASGERYNQNAMTAAHKTLPFGTQVRVTNLNNGQTAIVRINDRGPFVRGRIIDLSRAAASSLGMLGSGVAPVKVEILGQ
ncbi:septal ring lytic transglycosylase RlpA family protein [Spirulina sp. 06S082]|uniref:septal ring lytic transglycosylase RlpA family protein n=1 Tax=Spirulina sp. 06S082 TaxID=3110248 RepID=UPI002B2142AA|nr:septal ring lytic transglycosylase RlpA family protein [Spirulina sp. 06S082]MEA5470672.1 septal ring lytic transglycosylase RlpA family protein [Spirulina sp. 06S082]